MRLYFCYLVVWRFEIEINLFIGIFLSFILICIFEFVKKNIYKIYFEVNLIDI